MFKYKSLKKGILLSGITAAAIFGFNGCLEQRDLPTDELVTIYNSDMEKTNKLKPLDTMYVQISGLKPDKKHEIRILDSDKNLITMTQAYADENGVIKATPVWYDVGLKKPTEGTPKFTVDNELGIKSFYINVVDRYSNGTDTNFEQPFFYVIQNSDTLDKPEVTITAVTHPRTADVNKTAPYEEPIVLEVDDNITAEVGTVVNLKNYQKPKIYASKSNGEMENAFEEQNSKYMNGSISELTKVYLYVDELPIKIFNKGTDNDDNVSNIDIYVVPYGKKKLENMNLATDAVAIIPNATRAGLLDTSTLVWDINATNPDNENNSYSIVLDLNQDGKYTKGLDLDADGISDAFIDGADGVYTAGFIVKNTPANDPLPFKLTDSNGNGVASIPSKISGIDSRLYLSVDNIAHANDSIIVNISDNNNYDINETIDLKKPSTDDAVRFLKYIDNEKVFDINDYDGNGTLTISIADINFSTSFDVYPVDTNTTTHSSATSDTVTIFDETGTKDGDTSIFMKFGKAGATNASVYLFDGNITWDQNRSLDGSILNVTDLNITDQSTKTLVFNLDSNGTDIINPTANNGMFNIVVDYDNNGLYDINDTKLNITIRDTIANNLPNVGYINIASNGYFTFDNHNDESNQTSDYGYIDEFAVDGSNAYGKSIRAIWNPYLKNKKSGGFYANYYTTGDGNESVYVDENQKVQVSPFNFNQQLDLYIINAETYPLKKNMSLTDKDLRGEPQTITTQYSCSNGALMQSILDKNKMEVGKYNVILDINRNGILDDGIDYVDAVTQKGVKLSEDNPNISGFSIVTELQNTTTSWVREFGTSSVDYTTGIAADSDGKTYTVGYTYGTFADNDSNGSYDGFITKYSTDGNKSWTTQFGTSSYDYVTGVAASTDNAYVVGYTYGNIDDVNTSAQVGGYDGFITKFDTDGNITWSRQFGTSSSDYIQKVAIDSAENLYVSGYTNGTIDDNASAKVGRYDSFIVKYDKDGNKTWSRQFGTTSYDYTTNIAVNNDDDVYVTGYTNGTITDATKEGSYDGFVVKYDKDGNKTWEKQFGSSSADYPYGIDTDSSGNVYVSGYTLGSIDGENQGRYDGFIVKYSADGSTTSSKQFGTTSYDYFKEIAIDSNDKIYVSGYTRGKMDTVNAQNSFGSYDGVIVKFDTNLNKEWSKQFGTTSADYLESITVGGTDVYVGGRTYGEFSGQERVGSYDAFVGKIITTD